jgi:hypothetical protein
MSRRGISLLVTMLGKLYLHVWHSTRLGRISAQQYGHIWVFTAGQNLLAISAPQILHLTRPVLIGARLFLVVLEAVVLIGVAGFSLRIIAWAGSL